MHADLPRVLYVNGAAHLLGNTPKAVRNQVARKLIPFHRLGGRVIFLRDELESFLAGLPGCTPQEAVSNVQARNGTNGVARW